MPAREPALLIQDIVKSANKIISYTSGTNLESFSSNILAVDAVVRNVTIITQATNQLPDEFKQSHPQINWQQLEGFSNQITGVDKSTNYALMWEVKENLLSPLVKALEKI